MSIMDFWKKPQCGKSDPIGTEIKAKFSFLLLDYGFQFSKKNLGNAVDANGKFLFYGPLYCYSLYNANLCIHILYLAQRQEFNAYLTREPSLDQAHIRAGLAIPEEFTWDFAALSRYIEHSIAETGAVLGQKV